MDNTTELSLGISTFSNLTDTTLAMTSLMVKNLTCKLAVLKNILSLHWDC